METLEALELDFFGELWIPHKSFESLSGALKVSVKVSGSKSKRKRVKVSGSSLMASRSLPGSIASSSEGL